MSQQAAVAALAFLERATFQGSEHQALGAVKAWLNGIRVGSLVVVEPSELKNPAPPADETKAAETKPGTPAAPRPNRHQRRRRNRA